MGPQLPWVPPAFGVLGCALLLGLWALCSVCHRKRAPRQWVGRQGAEMPADLMQLRQTHLRTLSKSDTKLHELHRGQRGGRAPRPASMDLLHPHWSEGHRGTLRLPAVLPTCPHPELPQPRPVVATLASADSETYSNVGLAALPRASLAASPKVWSGAQLTSGRARPGLGPGAADNASIQKLKGADKGLHGQQKAEVTPASQVDTLYSRVNKPKRRDAGAPTVWSGQGVDQEPLENVYESILELASSGPGHM
ncbi:lck-interacting transmembrane adapter 1 [Tenrec ecaudatus]|uniref:lck-interacting transmembrane adapter 1 n=1 Tax=Tenrec ecaudatus TaxID=94439 RepID=UPI003F5A8460